MIRLHLDTTKKKGKANMKRTNYTTCTSYSMDGARAKWQRVYTNESGERFVKTKDGYKSIEGTPCIDWILEDE